MRQGPRRPAAGEGSEHVSEGRALASPMPSRVNISSNWSTRRTRRAGGADRSPARSPLRGAARCSAPRTSFTAASGSLAQARASAAADPWAARSGSAPSFTNASANASSGVAASPGRRMAWRQKPVVSLLLATHGPVRRREDARAGERGLPASAPPRGSARMPGPLGSGAQEPGAPPRWLACDRRRSARARPRRARDRERGCRTTPGLGAGAVRRSRSSSRRCVRSLTPNSAASSNQWDEPVNERSSASWKWRLKNAATALYCSSPAESLCPWVASSRAFRCLLVDENVRKAPVRSAPAWPPRTPTPFPLAGARPPTRSSSRAGSRVATRGRRGQCRLFEGGARRSISSWNPAEASSGICSQRMGTRIEAPLELRLEFADRAERDVAFLGHVPRRGDKDADLRDHRMAARHALLPCEANFIERNLPSRVAHRNDRHLPGQSVRWVRHCGRYATDRSARSAPVPPSDFENGPLCVRREIEQPHDPGDAGARVCEFGG